MKKKKKGRFSFFSSFFLVIIHSCLSHPPLQELKTIKIIVNFESFELHLRSIRALIKLFVAQC